LATVGVPPVIGTAPLLIKIRPVPSRLVTIVLAPVSPNSVSTPEEKLAVVAMGCDPEVLIARRIASLGGLETALNEYQIDFSTARRFLS
jgi:hypothetical protein